MGLYQFSYPIKETIAKGPTWTILVMPILGPTCLRVLQWPSHFIKIGISQAIFLLNSWLALNLLQLLVPSVCNLSILATLKVHVVFTVIKMVYECRLRLFKECPSFWRSEAPYGCPWVQMQGILCWSKYLCLCKTQWLWLSICAERRWKVRIAFTVNFLMSVCNFLKLLSYSKMFLEN